LVSFGIELQRDFSLPSGGDRPVEAGHGATSAGIHLRDFKRLIALVQNLEDVLNGFPFGHFLEIEGLLRQNHGRP
jgi:hypothetical protein